MKKAAVQKYETGEITDLKASKIRILCKTFHVHPWVFIYEDYEKLWNEIFGRFPEGGRRPTAEALTGQVVNSIEKTRTEDALVVSTATAQLNKNGRLRALAYIDDLLKINEYRNVKDKQSD